MSFAALDCERISVDLALTAVRERVPMLERELIDAFGQQLAGALAPFASGRDDGSSLFIDRLVIADAIGGKWDPEVIVRKVAARIATALSAEIDAGGGLRFRDRAEFVAAFIAALADGSAWSRWYFSEFDGFRALSSSNALRSVVLAEGEAGFAALARLTGRGAQRVIDSMTPADAARVLAAWRGRVTMVRAAVREMWVLSGTLERDIETDPRHWLAAMVVCERGLSGSAGEGAVELLQSMRALREICGANRLPALSVGDDPRPALQELAARFGLAPAWLDELNEAALQELVRELPASAASQPGVALWSEHGGVFLLMHLIMRLRWPDAWREMLTDIDARTLAFAIAAHAVAPEQAHQVVNDQALLRALEISEVRGMLLRQRRRCERALREIARDPRPQARPRPARALVGGRLGAALHFAGAQLLAEFGSRLPGLAESSPEYLRRNLLTLPAAVDTRTAGARVRLGRAPLDVLLTLAGCKRGSCELPGARMLELVADLQP
jgi:hypothetical protein